MRPVPRLLTFVTATATTLAIAPRAHAQQPVRLEAGFAPDPTSLRGVAGGPVEASRIGDNCRGYFPARPQHRIVTAGLPNVRIFTMAQSNADVTLAVVGPNNSIACDDDHGGNMQAMLDVRLGSGAYDVYVGTYQANGAAPYALVFTTNTALSPANMGGPVVQGGPIIQGGPIVQSNPTSGGPAPQNRPIDQAATQRPSGRPVRVRGPGVERVRGQTDGSAHGSSLHAGCTGFLHAEPYHVVNVGRAGMPLTFDVGSGADTTLVIRAPDGDVRCNDDTNGLNPQVVFPSSVPGAYTVWIGTYRAGLRNLYQLTVTAAGN